MQPVFYHAFGPAGGVAFGGRGAYNGSMDRRMGVFLLLSLLLAGLVLFHFPSREFYYDSADQIEAGIQTRAARFLVDHGRPSGAGVANPAYFSLFMGAVTWFTIDPQTITAMTAAVNVAALVALLWHLMAALPEGYGALAALVLVLTPSTIIYPTVLWEGSFLIPLAAVFWILAWRFAASPTAGTLLGMTLAATLASQNHQSGFFLFPTLGLLVLRSRRSLRPWVFPAAVALAGLLMAPYLYYLVRGGGGGALGHFLSYDWTIGLPLVLAVFLAAGTPLTIPFLFGFDRPLLVDVFSRALGPLTWPVLILSLLVTAAFAAGWLAYLLHAARNRMLIDTRDEAIRTMPIPFQVAGLAATVTAAAYLAASRYLWIKHLLILVPGAALLAAWPAWRWRRLPAIRLVAGASVASSGILLAAFLWSVRVSGGLPIHGGIQLYGPHYGTLVAAVREVLDQAGDRPVDLHFTGTWQSSLATIEAAERGDRRGAPVPVALNLWFDRGALRVRRQVIPLADRIDRHDLAVRRVAAGIPRGATVGLYPSRRWAGFSVGRIPPGPVSWEAVSSLLLSMGLAVVAMPDGRIPEDAAFLVIDTSNPATLATQPAAADQANFDLRNRLLLDPDWSLSAGSEGVYLFRRGAGNESDDRRWLAEEGLVFRAASFAGSPRQGESRDAGGRTVAILPGRPVEAETLTIRPELPSLPPGKWRAILRLRTTGHPTGGGVSLAAWAGMAGREVPLGGGQADAASLGPGSASAEVELPLLIPPGADDLVFRVARDGAASLEVAELRLLAAP